MQKKNNFFKVIESAANLGLVCRGGFNFDNEVAYPVLSQENEVKSILLFGQVGSSNWQYFSQSLEYADGNDDPMNRWSQRIAESLADEYSAIPLFPFGGPPYQPFLQWASRAEGLFASRLGMLIHPEYGVWHAYRFALAFLEPLPDKFNQPVGVDVCAGCETQPCLQACPVSAFDGSRYDVESCFRYLDGNQQATCHSQGCAARVACPVGKSYLYEPDQAAFHISQFLKSQSRQYSTNSSV